MKKILIAEDDPIYLGLLTNALEEHRDKLTVLTAKNGKAAVDVLRASPIALLVTDIKMPEMDGLQLLAHVNSHYPLIPCFVMTAYETPELRRRLPKDIRRFFRKPFPPEKLGPEILQILEKDSPQGFIHGISVSSFFMMIEMERKTCILEIRLPDGMKGLFYFEKGILQNAVSKDLKGEAAAVAFVNRKRAKFSFKPLPEKPVAKQQAMPLKSLIDKAARTASQDMRTGNSNDNDAAPVKTMKLPGRYRSADRQTGGDIFVTHLSIPSLRMLIENQRGLAPGTHLTIEFTLDDKPRSLIKKDIIINNIRDNFVDADFVSTDHYDRLGPYLHFNGLDGKTWQ